MGIVREVVVTQGMRMTECLVVTSQWEYEESDVYG